MPVCDVIIISTINGMLARSCGRCYHNSIVRSLVTVSTLVLRLKTAESFLETSQCTYKMWQILYGIGEHPD